MFTGADKVGSFDTEASIRSLYFLQTVSCGLFLYSLIGTLFSTRTCLRCTLGVQHPVRVVEANVLIKINIEAMFSFTKAYNWNTINTTCNF